MATYAYVTSSVPLIGGGGGPPGGLIEGIWKIFIANIRDFYTIAFGCERVGRGCIE